MQFLSTRGMGPVRPAQAILLGIAQDGGLFVPQEFPKLSEMEIEGFCQEPYERIAAEVISRYLTDIPKEELQGMCSRAYAPFSDREVAPVRRIQDGLYAMELFLGPTAAFKDIALQILPLLMAYSAKLEKQEKKRLILVATSGDTGKAALEGFSGKEGTEIAVYYPKGGVSDAQYRQMASQEGNNVMVFGVEGNFDACQRGVKAMMEDAGLIQEVGSLGYEFSSANSINFGRLVPQVAYYFHAYASLRRQGRIAAGEKIHFVVPTGNFGNILAGWYAKQMGLPIAKLICASNQNNVLSRFFASKVYDCRPALVKTSSPSMDILVSSNLERLLFEGAQRDSKTVCAWMEQLKERRVYQVPQDAFLRFEEDFYADWASDERGAETIRSTFEEAGYLLDTHSAIGKSVYDAYRERTQDETKAVLLCTASPYKFCQDVLRALGKDTEGTAPERLPQALFQRTGVAIPQAIATLYEKPILHTDSCAPDRMAQALVKRLKEKA